MIFSRHMRTCFLFPGQGAQYPGMGRDLWESSSGVKELFRRASDAAGIDMERLLFDAGAEELQATDKAQVALTLASLSSSLMLRESGVRMEGCAGFSLGEYTALHEAGVIRLEDLFPIVKLRGELMEKAARGLDSPAGRPGMAAVLGMPAEKVTAAVQALEGKGVYAANHNSPVQVVISGTAEGLAAAEEALKAAGARRLIRLKVSGPFHSPLMAEARAAFADALAGFAFSDPRVPVYSNATGTVVKTGEEARELCGRQLVTVVRWVSVEESLLRDGYTRFVEAGPGTVLTGLFRALAPQAVCVPAGKLEEIRAIA